MLSTPEAATPRIQVTDVPDGVAAERQRELERNHVHDLQRLEGVSRLAGATGHELNNLIGVILTYSSFLDAALEDRPNLQADLREITGAAGRSAELTRRLATFSRQNVAVPRRLDLREVVSHAEQLLRPALPANVTLSTVTPTEPCVVQADRHQIDRVLINLALNAGEAMPDGGSLTIELDTPTVAPEGAGSDGDRWVTLRVRDTGQGMSDAVAARAFEPFFTTRADALGGGLGLASVYGIVAGHHGHVDIDSREGVGTTVTVRLLEANPAAPPADATDAGFTGEPTEQ
jgi:signal transduction histidine kinase